MSYCPLHSDNQSYAIYYRFHSDNQSYAVLIILTNGVHLGEDDGRLKVEEREEEGHEVEREATRLAPPVLKPTVNLCAVPLR